MGTASWWAVTIRPKVGGSERREFVCAPSAAAAARHVVGTAGQPLGRYHFRHWDVVAIEASP